MRGLNVHKNIPVSITKLTPGLRVGIISSHLIADKLIPINLRAITGPPKMSLLLEAKSMPALIVKPRFILVTYTERVIAPWLRRLLLKEVGSARLRESDIHPISPNSPARKYQPINSKKGKNSRSLE